MKKILLLIFVCCFGNIGFANRANIDSIPVNPSDVSSVDAIIKAVYDVISGPAAQTRNWDRMRTLFISDARLIPAGKNQTSGEGTIRSLKLEDYIKTAGPFLEKNGFFESEIGRTTEQYGNIVQVFSSYESKKMATDENPFMRGINSIQLWNDGKRWWIVTIFWQSESPDNPIPQKYIGLKN